MTAIQQAPPTEQVYGIAKKISLELEKNPLHTHGAVISMLTTMAKHREACINIEQHQAQIDAQDAAMADARRAHAEAQVKREQQIAAQIAQQAAAPVDEPKKPRLSIVLDKPGLPSAEDLDAVEDEKNAALNTALSPKAEEALVS
jgi:hypothetical protein